jgi:hypothetical protein
MIYRYVDFSLVGWKGDLGLSENSPMGWDRFYVQELPQPSMNEDDEDVTYFIKNIFSTDLCQVLWEDTFNINLNIFKLNIFGTTGRNIYFKPYPSTNAPWGIVNRTDGGINITVQHSQSLSSIPNNLYLEGGMFQAQRGSISVVNQHNTGVSIVNSFYSRSAFTTSFPNNARIEINNSTLITPYFETTPHQTCVIRNAIFSGAIFNAWTNYQETLPNVSLDNVVFDRNLEDYYQLDIRSFGYSNIQEGYKVPAFYGTMDISAFNANNLSYLNPSFSGINVAGNSLYNTSPPWGQPTRSRDGIGFLSFPFSSPTITFPNGTSGYYPYEFDVNFNGYLTSGSHVYIEWDAENANIYYPNATSASHIYEDISNNNVLGSFRTKNGWYDYCSSIAYVNVSDAGQTSATFSVLNNTGHIVSTGYNNNTYTYSAYNINGRVISYELYTAVQNFSAYDFNGITSITHPIFYDIDRLGTVNAILYLNRGEPNEYQINASLGLLSTAITPPDPVHPTATYYVNLDDGVGVGVGTTASPFTAEQFISRINYQGAANINDVYLLRGMCTLNRPSNVSRPWQAINSDYRKNLSVDAWNASAYGPWVINIIDDYYNDNGSVSFDGVTLNNGIIYNRPLNSGNEYYGGSVTVSKLHNMWIVNQGVGSEIVFSPHTSGNRVEILGSTIYSDNDIDISTTSISNQAFNINIDDSVFNKINLTNGNLFSATSFTIRNSCFGGTSATFAGMTNVTLTNNQFGWVVVEDWPLVINKSGYGKSMSWFNSNKNYFTPFANISEPPNPGVGYSTYPLYQYGLWGFLRNLYNG